MVVQVAVGIVIGYILGRYIQRPDKYLDARRRPHYEQPPIGRRLHHFGDLGVIRLLVAVWSTYYSRLVSPFASCYEEPHDEQEHRAMKSLSTLDNEGESNDVDALSLSSSSSTSSTTSTTLAEGKAAAPIFREEEIVRTRLNDHGNRNYQRQSQVDLNLLPKHIAVIMDGNRRYGRKKYGSASRGHWDGSSKLIEFAKWCLAEQISMLTVYAFSTENWNRSKSEVDNLMELFVTHCEELRVEAQKHNIRVLVLSTDKSRIPPHVQAGLDRLVQSTKFCGGCLTMNICLSYGSRGEIVQACKSLASDAIEGKINAKYITEQDFEQRLLTSSIQATVNDRNHDKHLHGCPAHDATANNPDVLIRTSGEVRVSNFLLWQMAYTEMFFLSKTWPEIEKGDLLRVIDEYADGRSRRFGA